MENRPIKQKILELYAKTDKRLGPAKIAICLKRDYCIHISSARVYRLMKQMDLPKMSTCTNPRHYFQTSSENNYLNILAQNFNQPAPNMVWAADFTYAPVKGQFYYICAIMDLFTRKIIACRVSSKIDIFLAIDTLRDAVRIRGVSDGIIFHADRGSQFTSSDLRKEIDRLNMIQSFSAKGHPYDNAVMECFFKFLKKEELNRGHFQSLEQLKESLLTYICGFYNSIRPHSHNLGLSPNQAELSFFN